jgi:hypothetical protein
VVGGGQAVMTGCRIDRPGRVRARWIVMTSDAERTAIDRLTQRLSARFPLLEAAVVARVVRAAHHRFDDHPTRDVVPILVEDTARDVLRVMPTAGGRDRRRRDR